jgi:outer membrane cobalamin receptor
VTVWEALDRLVKYAVFSETSRGVPDRIRRRGSSTINLREDMMVVVDGLRILDVTALGDMPAGIIVRIEVMSGLDGTTRYGTNATDGVILVTTRAPEL